jgi:hypothetical protein
MAQSTIFTIYNFQTSSNNYQPIYTDTIVSFRSWDASIDVSGDGRTAAVGRIGRDIERLSIYTQEPTGWIKLRELKVNDTPAILGSSALPSINYNGELISFVRNPAPSITGLSFLMMYNKATDSIDSTATRGLGIEIGHHKMTEDGTRIAYNVCDGGNIIQDTACYYEIFKFVDNQWKSEYKLAYEKDPIGYISGTNLQFDCSGSRFSTSDLDGIVYIYDLDQTSATTDRNLKRNLRIYPNPHRESFYLEGILSSSRYSIKAFDLLGYEIPIKGNPSMGYEILGNPGLYTITIIENNKYYSYRLLKQ